jgi:hypothetical protein
LRLDWTLLYFKKGKFGFHHVPKNFNRSYLCDDVPSTTGYGSFNTNIGEISNKGVEIGLTVRPVVTSNFTWELRERLQRTKTWW